MGLNFRVPPPPEANPNTPVRPTPVLEYWPPTENVNFKQGSAILRISIKGRNFSNPPWIGKDEEIIHGTLEIEAQKDKPGTHNYLFKISDLQFHEAAYDAVWNLQAELTVDGVQLHRYDFPCIHVHGNSLPNYDDMKRAAESKAIEDFKEKIAETKTKLANVTHMWW